MILSSATPSRPPLDKARPILVTGATGSLGPAVVESLQDAGYQVRALVRNAAKATELPAGVEVCIGDITDQAALESAVAGVGGVVHAAALLHIVDPPESLRPEYQRINVGATAELMRAAANAKVERVVFFSTIAVYGNCAGQIVTEADSPHPDTFYGETKREAEEIVLNARRADGQPLGTVLRLAAVYGGRIKGNYRRLLSTLSRRRFVPLGAGLNKRTLIYEGDVGAATVLALEHPAAGGKVYNVSDGAFHTVKEIIAAMCQALDRPAPRMHLPIKPAYLAAAVAESGFGLIRVRAPVRRSMLDKYTEDITVSSELIQRELGFAPKVGLELGWRETVRVIRRSGGL
ncbi:MAG TPA: NAD-dependent epimerase/dehydratase family protein [Pyrinomonadaceae bacterium]|nr:NAD-dependent epimerase/dehydratase family protein [Pyrinomonadaceae bacterium]